ncbi:MAG: hypothetical protein IJ316_03650 [Clostridia bacterium]|nr:hypothetical protein [Clostridia bacterium]
MNEKTLSLDFVVKSSNLCSFLSSEKSENLISKKFFDAVCLLSECAYSIKNPQLSKAETATLRKDASLASDRIQMYLNVLYMTGYLSEAQKDSMLHSLGTLKKEINI